MVILKLAYVNAMRIWRHNTLRSFLIILPFVFAIPRAAFTKNVLLLRAAEICPFLCALSVYVVLDRQWAVDKAAGLIEGLRSCPISRRAIIASRAVSGALVLAAQMAIFGGILALRF